MIWHHAIPRNCVLICVSCPHTLKRLLLIRGRFGCRCACFWKVQCLAFDLYIVHTCSNKVTNPIVSCQFWGSCLPFLPAQHVLTWFTWDSDIVKTRYLLKMAIWPYVDFNRWDKTSTPSIIKTNQMDCHKQIQTGNSLSDVHLKFSSLL